MTPISSRRILCGVTLAAVVAGTAVAATPDNGTVSESAPKVEWTGETTGGYLSRMPTAVSGSTDTPCEAPSCDTFTLKVEKSANLTVAESLDTDSADAAFTLRITKPDGEVIQTNSDPGGASNKYVKVVIKNAPTGEYVINHYDNSADGTTFKAYAELAVPGAPAAPPATGGSNAPPAPQQQQTGPQPAPQPNQSVQALDVQVKVGKLSAKKLKKAKKLAAKVTVSRAVTGITAALKKGSKVLAKGSVGSASGTVTMKLKLSKKVKKGKYTLAVVATDGKTSTEKVIKVKVVK
jgi:hypothetical protein